MGLLKLHVPEAHMPVNSSDFSVTLLYVDSEESSRPFSCPLMHQSVKSISISGPYY